MTFTIQSAAFSPNGTIPREHTCDGKDRSPELSWTDPPPNTRRFALIADDPDAPGGTWVHWVVYDIPGEARKLSAGIPGKETLADGSKQGITDFRKIGYGGPCPPPGKPHRYFFKLLALDRETGLRPGATKKQVLEAAKGHIVGQVEIVGLYGR